MRSKHKRLAIAVVTVAALFAVYFLLEFLRQSGVIGKYWAQVMDLSLIMTISALGLSLIYGFAGQFSLGHAAFYGIGAYTAAYVTKTMGADQGTFVLALIAGAAAAGLVGFIIGMPILRLRSDYLGIATLGLGEIVRVLLENSDKLSPVLGGSRGMLGIEKLTTFAWTFWLAVFAIILTRNLVNSAHGRACIAVREDEVAADIMGVNTTRYKVMAFVIGCALAGLAGGLYAHAYRYLTPASFNFMKSLDVLLIVVLGGLGSLTGTVVTATGLTFLQEWLRALLPQDFLDWRGVIYALILIVLMIVRPQGLLGGKEFTLFRRTRPTPQKGGSSGASA